MIVLRQRCCRAKEGAIPGPLRLFWAAVEQIRKPAAKRARTAALSTRWFPPTIPECPPAGFVREPGRFTVAAVLILSTLPWRHELRFSVS